MALKSAQTKRMRRERMGHIELASPVAHLVLEITACPCIGLLLDVPLRDIERVPVF